MNYATHRPTVVDIRRSGKVILRALSSLRGLRGAPAVPPLCRETQSHGQQMLELSCENATVGTNELKIALSREGRKIEPAL